MRNRWNDASGGGKEVGRDVEDEADGFGFPAIDAGDVRGLQDFQVGFAGLRVELGTDFWTVEPGLSHQQNTIQHVRELTGGGVVWGFALRDDTEMITFRLTGDGDPQKMIKK